MRDFFAGLKIGIKSDPLIWLLLVLNSIAGWMAYHAWFVAPPDKTAQMWRNLTAELPKLFGGD